MNGPDDRLTEFEDRWREWASSQPTIDEDQIRAALPVRLPSRRRRRARVILLAAAACVVFALFGVRALYLARSSTSPPPARERSRVVHHLDGNVVLLISRDSEPLYIMLADVPAGKGELS